MFATDDDVGVAEILAIDRVHDRLFRPGVEHLDVQSKQEKLIRQVVANLFPERLVLITLPQDLVVDERAIRPHARGGVHIVPLGFADQRIEHGTRKMLFPRQPLDAGDQGIFMRPVQRVAGLEGDHALPAALAEKGTRLARRQHEIAIFGMLGLRQDAHIAAD